MPSGTWAAASGKLRTFGCNFILLTIIDWKLDQTGWLYMCSVTASTMPGGSQSFDLYDGHGEVRIAAKRKRFTMKQYQSLSNTIRLQVSRGINSEAAQAEGIWCAAPASGRDPSRFGGAQGVEDRGGAPDRESLTHVSKHPDEAFGLERGLRSEGRQRDPDGSAVRRPARKIHRRAHLGARLLLLAGGCDAVKRAYVRAQE
jgi:hypothetical protein